MNEPKPSERTYYRSTQDGQRAYLVRHEGQDMLRLDRPMEELYRKIDGTWIPDTQTYAASLHQIAKVAFVADLELCRVMGQHVESKKDWLNLKEQARIKWMNEGPATGDIREDLFDAIMGTLKGMAGG